MIEHDLIAPLGRQVYPADPWVVIQQSSRLTELERDLARDPEGHFWRTGPADRRVPPWHATISETPERVKELLTEMLQHALQDPTTFSLELNWYAETIDLVRWLPSVEQAWGRVGQIVKVPVELVSIPAAWGWAAVDERLLRLWRGGFQSISNPEAVRQMARAREVYEAERVIGQLAELVASGYATGEQRERYEAALNVRDGTTAADEGRELAKEARPIFRKLAEELGV